MRLTDAELVDVVRRLAAEEREPAVTDYIRRVVDALEQEPKPVDRICAGILIELRERRRERDQ